MNFRDRGFTVGDLLIVLLIVSMSYLIFIKVSEDKNQQKINMHYSIELLN